MSDHIYIKNKQRARAILTNRIRASQKYTPQYIKHDLEPVDRTPVDSSDSLYSKKDPKPIKRGSPAPLRHNVSSGANYEHTWLDGGQQDPNEPIGYDEVPSPPEREEHQDYERITEEEGGSVEPGEYCILVDGEMVYSSSDLEEIEEAIQLLVYEKKAAQMTEISVFKRLRVRLGISVRDD